MKRIASLPARLWAKLRSFRLTKKRVFALAAVCLVAVLGLGAWRRFAPRGGTALPAMGELVRTTRLERQTLSESITVTGTVQSGSVTNVTTALTYPVKEILVQVGDFVREGDVICRLDASDLEKELEQKQKQLAENKAAAQKSYDRALESYNSAVTAQSEAERDYYAAGGALETARNTQYLSAADSVRPYQQTYDAAQAAENDAGIAENNAAVALSGAAAALSGAQSARDAAAAARDAAQAALSAAPEDAGLQAALSDAEAALSTAESALASAQADYDAAAGAHAAARDAHAARTAERENAARALQEAKQNSGYDALYQAYAQADEAFLRAKEVYERAADTAKQAKETLDSAADALKKASDSDDLADLYERIEDCTITAGANGTVTALNATVGSSAGGVNGGALAVLQDTDHLKVAITIDEDDIKRVSVGQTALIRSDATGDAEIAGRLSQLSLTAASSGGFGAEVTVTDADSGLLIGLSAKVELILTQAENVYAIPYEALETDETGQTVVYARMPGEAEFSPVPVETGLETDYYVEIRGEGLADGMEVRVGTENVAAADGGFLMDGAFMTDGGQVFLADGGAVTVSPGPSGDAPMGGPGGGMPGGPGGM